MVMALYLRNQRQWSSKRQPTGGLYQSSVGGEDSLPLPRLSLISFYTRRDMRPDPASPLSYVQFAGRVAVFLLVL